MNLKTIIIAIALISILILVGCTTPENKEPQQITPTPIAGHSGASNGPNDYEENQQILTPENEPNNKIVSSDCTVHPFLEGCDYAKKSICEERAQTYQQECVLEKTETEKRIAEYDTENLASCDKGNELETLKQFCYDNFKTLKENNYNHMFPIRICTENKWTYDYCMNEYLTEDEYQKPCENLSVATGYLNQIRCEPEKRKYCEDMNTQDVERCKVNSEKYSTLVNDTLKECDAKCESERDMRIATCKTTCQTSYDADCIASPGCDSVHNGCCVDSLTNCKSDCELSSQQNLPHCYKTCQDAVFPYIGEIQDCDFPTKQFSFNTCFYGEVR